MTDPRTSTDPNLAAPPQCPKCSGDMWDNRIGKRNPRAPDYKCKNRECDGVIWPPRDAKGAAAPAPGASPAATAVGATPAGTSAQAPKAGTDADGMPLCPICGGAMWDDRLTKRNPKAPD